MTTTRGNTAITTATNTSARAPAATRTTGTTNANAIAITVNTGGESEGTSLPQRRATKASWRLTCAVQRDIPVLTIHQSFDLI